MALVLPDINGSSGVWGGILNDALNGMDARITTNAGKIQTLETATPATGGGMQPFASTAARDSAIPTPTPGQQCITTDTNLQWVGVTGIWVPVPGQLICSAWQITDQLIDSQTAATVINWAAGDLAYNPMGWLSSSTNQFTPTIPGWYEFTGGVSFEMGPTTGSPAPSETGIRLGYFRHNGGSSHPGTAGPPTLSATTGTVLSLCTAAVFLNGTTDFVELCAVQTSGVALKTMTIQGYQRPNMGVKYAAAPI